MNSNIKEIQSKLNSKTNLALCDEETIKYATKPIGRALISGKEKIKEKAKWNDIITCKRCGKTFIRSNRSAHNKTKFHKIYDEVGKKFQKILLDN